MEVRDQYLKNQVTSSSKEQLLVMLLEGAERFIRIAQKEIEKKNVESVHENIVKSQNIYLELFCTLDPEAGEYVQNLHGLYYFMYHNLQEADITKDPAVLDNCLKVAQGITQMWKDTISKYHEEKGLNSINNNDTNMKSIDIRG
jgi:flagellar protein FliS